MRRAPYTILTEVATVHGVTTEDILGASRKQRITDARKMVFAMLYEMTDLSPQERANYLHKDRVSGLYAVRTHYDLLDTSEDYNERYRKVMNRLRAKEKPPRQLYAGKIVLQPCRV